MKYYFNSFLKQECCRLNTGVEVKDKSLIPRAFINFIIVISSYLGQDISSEPSNKSGECIIQQIISVHLVFKKGFYFAL